MSNPSVEFYSTHHPWGGGLRARGIRIKGVRAEIIGFRGVLVGSEGPSLGIFWLWCKRLSNSEMRSGEGATGAKCRL